jgi:GNAT superfamily N-acetyltransferase
MIDMLVRLYDLPDSTELNEKLSDQGIILRRPGAYEKHLVAEFVREHFSPKWVSEVEVAFSRQPLSCFIATREKEILGFACYETTCRAFFGPTGVAKSARGSGIGKALLFKALDGLKELGYAYGFIGGVGPKEFYANTVGAEEITGSDPGIYVDVLPEPPSES